ncbi:MAG: flagellar motor protein MotB [Planctomycetota bacterium]
MKYTMMIVALFCAAATSCVSPEAHRRLKGENGALKAQISDMSERLRELATRASRLENQNQELGERAADAAWIKEKQKEIAGLLANYGEGGSTQVPGVDLVSTSEGYAFRVAGGVLFESGQNALTEGGKRTLTELVASLQGRNLRVEGHTDDVPITRSRWSTNLRLSVERAMTVADFLVEAGLPRNRVSSAGYGPNRPAVDGQTDEARRANRRVEILMLDR